MFDGIGDIQISHDPDIIREDVEELLQQVKQSIVKTEPVDPACLEDHDGES
jgi:hypothetical protein